MFLYVDESGNLGSDGRYFVIATVATDAPSSLDRRMKRDVLTVKRRFPKYQTEQELKASQASPVVKDYMLRHIAAKDVQISYIVADLPRIRPELKEDKNCLYNYLLHFLVMPYVLRYPYLQIEVDERTVPVQSVNSFRDYIKLKALYEMELSVRIKVEYRASDTCFGVQAADFVANGVYHSYEKQQDHLLSLLRPRLQQVYTYPPRPSLPASPKEGEL